MARPNGKRKGVSWVRTAFRKLKREVKRNSVRALSKYERKAYDQMLTKRS